MATALFFKNFETIELLSTFWLATQDQTSTFPRQTLDPFYADGRAEMSEFITSVKEVAVALKTLSNKVFQLLND